MSVAACICLSILWQLGVIAEETRHSLSSIPGTVAADCCKRIPALPCLALVLLDKVSTIPDSHTWTNPCEPKCLTFGRLPGRNCKRDAEQIDAELSHKKHDFE
jgi:hypothetical protein